MREIKQRIESKTHKIIKSVQRNHGLRQKISKIWHLLEVRKFHFLEPESKIVSPRGNGTTQEKWDDLRLIIYRNFGRNGNFGLKWNF